MATAMPFGWKEQEREEHARRLTGLRERFEQSLTAAALARGGCSRRRRAAAAADQQPGLSGDDGEVLRMALDLAGVACSVGSACSSGSTELSPTLRAMGLPKELLASSLRFSLGDTTSEAEIDEAVNRIVRVFRQVGTNRKDEG